ncbi:nucleoside/nucleotide kinase family protein [Streptomyces specialis]|uniref:hypothetical protein n=1 Tax=Streptomyces specialis TaxID=498367 RepID=UPI000ADDAA02|nr:hypothetical protein [Streptomyces specialis]
MPESEEETVPAGPGAGTSAVEALGTPLVVLTSSPLQRVGAFALACLAGVTHPDELDATSFRQAVGAMTADLVMTTTAAKPTDEGGFWLGASYAYWPNSAINPTARSRQSPAQREELIRRWRAEPADTAGMPGVPCTYCGRAACGWFGKVDIPLGASVAHRNTTAPGHQGTPLCYPCLAALWAFPYAAALFGGRAAVLHSWDDAFLAQVTRAAVVSTRRTALLGWVKGPKPGPYARELAVLVALRGYGRPIRAPLELLVLSNSNKDPSLVSQEMSQPVAEWLRSTARSQNRSTYRVLAATQATPQVPGEAFLAKRAFSRPAAILHAAVGHLLKRITAEVLIPPEALTLAPLVYSYCHEVLTLDEKDVERVRDLARRVAALLSRDDRPGPFRDFIRANTRAGDLHNWFRSKGVDWLVLPRPQDSPPVLLPVRDYRLLFEDERSRAWRRLLVFAVLEALGEAGWQPRGSQEELRELRDLADTVSADDTGEEAA